MTTLADKSLLSGGDNKPQMLEKHLYDSWKSRMELYMMNRPHGRMILASVEKETIQADCEIKEIKHHSTSLPTEDICSCHQHRVAKDIWGEKLDCSWQVKSVTKQEPSVRWEGHMSKKCTKPRRKQDDSWFKEKVLLVIAQASGQILHEEELAFLADPGIPISSKPPDGECRLLNCSKEAVQNSNSSAQQDALILSVIEQLKTQVANCTKINLENKSVNDTLIAELERYKEQVKVLNEGQNVALTCKDNVSDSCAQSLEIDHLKQTLFEHLKEKESLMQTVSLLKDDFKKEESRNIDREISLEKMIKQLDNIVFKRDQSAQTIHMLTKPQFFYDHTTKQAIETLMLAKKSRSKMLLKQKDPLMLEKKVNTTLVDYAALNQQYKDFESRFVLQTELSAEQAFWSHNSVNSSEPILSSRPTVVEVPKELPKVSMVNTSLKKLKHHLAGFDVVVKERTHPQLSLRAVEQHRLESKTFEVKMNQVLKSEDGSTTF
ncbi:hypothetical protein Tco_0801893 [Tanacetum coccineum]|uniref:Uncharacterized protein n=1 Tax=Tanacetum coccineum TaxID=301880 RepID=A0ABQ4ZY56_9ASTR